MGRQAVDDGFAEVDWGTPDHAAEGGRSARADFELAVFQHRCYSIEQLALPWSLPWESACVAIRQSYGCHSFTRKQTSDHALRTHGRTLLEEETFSSRLSNKPEVQ